MFGVRAIRRWGISIVAVCGLAACQPLARQTTTTLQHTSAASGEHRILLLPLDVELGELNAGGMVEPRADWTQLAKSHLQSAMQRELDATRSRIVPVVESDAERDDKQFQIMKLCEAVGMSIWQYQYMGVAQLPTKPNDSFSWTLGPDVRYLGDKHDAQYALFVFIRDSYATSGRIAFMVIAAAFGVGIPGGMQIGFASLVDLKTGEVVWFNSLDNPSGDLRTAKAASETTKDLLSSFPR